MHFQESQYQSCLYGVIDSGVDPIDELTRLVSLRNIVSGTLGAMGTLRNVVLLQHKSKSWQEIDLGDAECRIVHLTGNIARVGSEPALRVEVLLSIDAPVGQQLIHGHLKSAEVMEFEYTLTAFDDLHAERRLDAGLLRLAEIKPNPAFNAPAAKAEAPKPVPETPQRPARGPVERIAEPRLGKAPEPTDALSNAPEVDPDEDLSVPTASWADVVQASAEPTKTNRAAKKPMPTPKSKRGLDQLEEADDDRALVEPGDVLDHPTLGRCRVMRIEDEDFAHIRLERGGIRKLALEICEITHVEEKNGRNVFKVKIKR